jgi:hypothetical protein
MLVDAHVHVVDFLQQQVRPHDLVTAMSESGVDRAVVFGLPVKKKWPINEPRRPGYYLDGNAPCQFYSLTDELVADLHARLPADVAPFVAPTLCGFDPTDLLAIEHVDLMWSRHDCWRGIGEVMLRHDDLTNLTNAENPSASHPALDPVFDFAAGHDVPVAVHHDSSSSGRPGEHEYIGQLDQMLARHSRTTVVWCHAGVSRRVEPRDQHRVVADLLDRHDRLHVDISWVLLDQVFTRDGTVHPDWHELLVRHPDRFVLGSDVVGPKSDWSSPIDRLTRVLDQLPASARTSIAAGNATRLWWNN